MGYGKDLKNKLEKLEMTVADLARLTGISEQTLYSIIRRDSNRIDIENYLKIEEAISRR